MHAVAFGFSTFLHNTHRFFVGMTLSDGDFGNALDLLRQYIMISLKEVATSRNRGSSISPASSISSTDAIWMCAGATHSVCPRAQGTWATAGSNRNRFFGGGPDLSSSSLLLLLLLEVSTGRLLRAGWSDSSSEAAICEFTEFSQHGI